MNKKAITTKMNLMELYYGLVPQTHEKFAERFYYCFSDFCIKIDDEDIFQAMKFRLKNKKKKLSYIDCLGYIMARRNNALFLTGDKEFKGMEGVVFVKWLTS